MVVPSQSAASILVLGAAGQFGARLCARLAQLHGVRLVLAGRDSGKLEALQQDLQRQNSVAAMTTLVLNIAAPDFNARLRTLRPMLVLHLAGPFQGQDYEVARACIEAGSSYIDMADGRAFVRGFPTLDTAARERGVSLITGASTVPGFSAAAVDAFLPRFARLESLDYGISAGLKTGLGRATLLAVLSYCGKSYDILRGGVMQPLYGLGRPRHHVYPLPVGRRMLVDCDIPDHVLFPARYPTLRAMDFGSCIDAPGLGNILGAMSRAVARGYIRHWDFLNGCIAPFIRAMKIFGSSASGFYMTIQGCGHDGEPKQYRFEVVAYDGCGLEIPVTPVLLLVKRLLRDGGLPPGAYPCLDLFTLRDFAAELAAYPIAWYVDGAALPATELP